VYPLGPKYVFNEFDCGGVDGGVCVCSRVEAFGLLSFSLFDLTG
jgi:hypothetical protein